MKRLVLTVTYNERENIGPLIRAVRAAGFTLLVVDDRGADDTAGAVAAFAATDPGVHLIAREGRGGYASASRAGLEWALAEGYEQIAQLDADGSHQPEVLPQLFAALTDADLAIGSRYVPGGGMPGLSRRRRLISRLAGLYLRVMLKLPVADPTSGYRAWRAPLLAAILPLARRAEGFAFLYETVCYVVRHGAVIREVPIVFQERRAGESKMSWRIIRDAVRVTRRLR